MPLKGQVGRAGIGASTTAVLLGTGDTTTPYSDSNADKNFHGYWLKSTATSGTTRGIYQRLYLSSGAGGEAARYFTTVENATPADTCNGAHISINFGSSAGNITGLGTAVRATFHVPNRSLTGTTAPLQAELYSDGASSAIGGTTSFIRAVNDGNATGKASVDSSADFIEISGLTAGSGKLWESAGTVGQSLRVNSGGTKYYIPTLPATTTGIVFGVGSSASNYNFGATANKDAVDFYFTTAATSGTSRGLYNRLYLTGGAGGEALRTFTTVSSNAPADTVNGAHLSLDFGASAGNVTGLGTAARCTFHVPNRSLTGTTAAVMAELFSDGASSAIGGRTSFLRVVNDGNASGIASVDTNAHFVELSGLTAGSGKLWESAGTVGQSLRINSGGTNYYIPTLPATTTGIVFGVGSSTANYNFGSTADKNAVNFHLTTAAATGTSRGIYNRLYLTGGAGGESLRTYTTVSSNTPADTVNGAHISLDFGAAAGNITGLGTASRSTLHIPASRTINGTIAAVQAEIYGDGASGAIGGAASFLRCVVDGHADLKGSVDSNGYLMDVAGVSAGANNLFRTGLTAATINAATTCALRIRVAGTTYYIPVATATA